MVTGDKVRLNHELLRWVGFTRHGRIWTYPDGVDIDNGTPYFPEDFNACLKWILPKDYEQIIFQPEAESDWTYCGIVVHGDLFESNGETMTIALCLAIQELIRSK